MKLLWPTWSGVSSFEKEHALSVIRLSVDAVRHAAWIREIGVQAVPVYSCEPRAEALDRRACQTVVMDVLS